MKRWWDRASRSALRPFGSGFGFGCLLAVVACDATPPGGSESATETSGSESDTETEGDSATSMSATGDTIGWFEIGWGEDQYTPIADGDAFPIVRGGQGAEMFPMPLRGAEFYLPADPTSWMDETGPLVDIEIDIDGFNDGPSGHFKRIANYTLDWVVREDGTYESSFLPIIVPDGIDSDELDGKTAHIWVRLRPFEQPSLELELDVVVDVMSAPPPG